MGERNIERSLRHDFSIGTEAFRDSLLARCLALMDVHGAVVAIDDSDFELLAAAGTPFDAEDPLA